MPRQTLNIYTKHKYEITTKKLAQNELHKGKLVRQSQIVQNAMYSHMYDAIIVTQFVYNSCHSLLVSEGF